MPPSASTATSVVPPPMSTIMLPSGSLTGKPAPIAAAIGSSISETLRAPAASVASSTASRSTFVIPLGTQSTTRANEKVPPPIRRMSGAVARSTGGRRLDVGVVDAERLERGVEVRIVLHGDDAPAADGDDCP